VERSLRHFSRGSLSPPCSSSVSGLLGFIHLTSAARRLLKLSEASHALKMTVPQLRRLTRKQGAPGVQRGRRGRGGATIIDVDVFAAWLSAKGRQRGRLELQEARREAFAQAAQAVDDVLAEILHRNELGTIQVKPWLAERIAGYLWTRLQLSLRELAEREGGLPLPKLTPDRQLRASVDNDGSRHLSTRPS